MGGSPKDGKLLYHLTSMENMAGILEKSLLPRTQLQVFDDIADSEIILMRQEHDLDEYIPFHFFAKNPFDGKVQKMNPEKSFAIITIRRTYARDNGFLIIPRHPLSDGDLRILDYNTGIERIDWCMMDKKDFSDRYCKNCCMAECITSQPISHNDFHSVFVRDEHDKRSLEKLERRMHSEISLRINVSKYMFIG